MAQRSREGTKLLAPMINARREEEMKGEKENPVLPFLPLSWKLIFVFAQEDFLTWIMNAAKGVDKETDAIVERMFLLNFGAIHTSSVVSFPNSRPEY